MRIASSFGDDPHISCPAPRNPCRTTWGRASDRVASHRPPHFSSTIGRFALAADLLPHSTLDPSDGGIAAVTDLLSQTTIRQMARGRRNQTRNSLLRLVHLRPLVLGMLVDPTRLELVFRICETRVLPNGELWAHPIT